MNRVLYREWFPQIMYNHHQTGPAGHGDVRAAVPRSVQLQLRSADSRPARPRRRGDAQPVRGRRQAGRDEPPRRDYSTWWNGGLRTTVYFHNMIGLLTETIGNPTPIAIPFLPQRQLPDSNLHCADRAAGVALPAVDRLLGHRQLRGPRHRLAEPREVPLQHLPDGEELDRARQPRQLDGHAAPRSSPPQRALAPAARRTGARQTPSGDEPATASAAAAADAAGSPEDFEKLLRDPAMRDPRGFILPVGSAGLPDRDEVRQRADQDRRHRAPRDRAVHRRRQELSGRIVRREGGAGVPAARARHVRAAGPPGRFPVSGRPADPPVRQRRLDAGVPDGREVRPHPRRLRRPVREARAACRSRRPGRSPATGTAGYPDEPCDERRVHRRQPAAGGGRRGVVDDVGPAAAGRSSSPPGRRRGRWSRSSRRISGSTSRRRRRAAPATRSRSRSMRIALGDQYGGSMPSGWTRWILEQFEFPFDVVFPQELDAGNLRPSTTSSSSRPASGRPRRRRRRWRRWRWRRWRRRWRRRAAGSASGFPRSTSRWSGAYTPARPDRS